MSIEEELKDLILKRYHSIREFTMTIDMPYTTMDSIFRRGIGNSSVSNIIKICKALGISADALADGEIVFVEKKVGKPSKNISNMIEIKDVLSETRELLSQNGFVTLDGKPISKNGIESIMDAMDIGVEMVKKKL